MIQKIIKLMNSCEFQKLNSHYDKTTFFSALNIERNENRHSAFVCWWLNPVSDHGLGDAPLKLFLRLIASKQYGRHIFKNGFFSKVLAGNYAIDVVEQFEVEKNVGKISSNESKNRLDIWTVLSLTSETDNGSESLVVPIVIENKIYSGIGKSQIERYTDAVISYLSTLDSNVESSPIGVLLSVDEVDEKCLQFTNITYQDLLTYVIEPLMHCVAVEKQAFVDAFVRNLGHPMLTEKKHYGVLAISQKEATMLNTLVESYKEIFDKAFASLYAPKSVKNILGKEVYASINLDDEEEIDVLRELWDANEMVFKSVIYHLYREHRKELDKLFKGSNRDNSKYRVFYNDKEIFPNKRLSKAMTACAIFKAYLMENPSTTLAELQQKFPCKELNSYYYDRYYNDLFYEVPTECDEGGYAVLTRTGGKDEGTIARAEWDFYLDDEKLLPISQGAQKAMCVKMWRKGDFDRLIVFVGKMHYDRFITIKEC